MHGYTKTILIIGAVIAFVFLLIRFAGVSFISKLSPGLEITTDTTQTADTKAVVGNDAPYFDLAMLSGGRINSVDIQDHGVVLTFWSTWSAESLDQIKIYDDYLAGLSVSDRELSARILTIDSQENKTAVENVIRRGGYSIDVLLDQNGETSNVFGVQTLPTSFFIDRDGKIVEKFVGVMSQKDLVDKMEKILH